MKASSIGSSYSVGFGSKLKQGKASKFINKATQPAVGRTSSFFEKGQIPTKKNHSK